MMIHSTTSGSSSSGGIRLPAGLMAPKLSMLSPVLEDPEDRANAPMGIRSPPKSSPTRDEATTRQQIMYARFQAWALRNYGELGKTKTVTRSKYNRVKAILKGEEPATADNSKLRFWVKAKGFRLGKFAGKDAENADTELLYIPSKHHSADLGPGEKAFKRVAVVEDFFDIIYNVHVEMDGRGGKHAGQKRTYRAIAQTYAFLPREAVTKFLMSCSDCQKRMHLTMDSAYSIPSVDTKPSCAQLGARDPPPPHPTHPLLASSRSSGVAAPSDRHHPFDNTLQITDYTLPITVSYLNYLKQKKKNKAKAAAAAAVVAMQQQQSSERQRRQEDEQEEEEDDDDEGGYRGGGGGEDAEEVGASSPPSQSLQQQQPPPPAAESSELRNAVCYRDDEEQEEEEEEGRIDGISTYQAMADSSSASPQLSPGDSSQVVFSADQSSNYEPMAVDKDEPKTTDDQENSPLDLSSSNSTEHDSANYDEDINVVESMELSYDVRESLPPPSELCQLPVDVKISEDEDKGDHVTRKDTTGRGDLSGNIKGRRFFDRTASPEEGYKVNFSRSAPSDVQVKSVSLSPCHSVQSTSNTDHRPFARGHFFQPMMARVPLLTDAGHSDIRRFGGGGGLFDRPSGIRDEYKSLCEVVARATVPLHPPPSSAPVSLMALPGGRPAAFHSGGGSSGGTGFLPCFPLNYGPITKTNILSKKPDNFFQTDLAPSMAMTTRDSSPFKLGKAFQFSELVTIRQIIAGYRDSAAFLRRSADELELLLLQQK